MSEYWVGFLAGMIPVVVLWVIDIIRRNRNECH
jgi:hypothetical protein